jgi:hypothetical protein
MKPETTMARPYLVLIRDGINGAIALLLPRAITRDEVGVFPRTMLMVMKKTFLQSGISSRPANFMESIVPWE